MPPSEADILQVHDAGYYQRLRLGQLTRQEERATGFPWSAALFEREITILGGTIEARPARLAHGRRLQHCRRHAPCLSRPRRRVLPAQRPGRRGRLAAGPRPRPPVLIVDLDVHQGNGTAAIFQHEPRVFTFSMHGARNYPARKEPSDLDLPLPDGTDDAAYLKLLADTLPRLLDEVQPDFVFYLAGVDVLATDKLGHLALTRAGCRQRDELVLGLCHRHRLPVVVCMGGGYSERISDIVEAHANTFRVAAQVFGTEASEALNLPVHPAAPLLSLLSHCSLPENNHLPAEGPAPAQLVARDAGALQQRLPIGAAEGAGHRQRRIVLHQVGAAQQPRQPLNAVVGQPVPVQVVDHHGQPRLLLPLPQQVHQLLVGEVVAEQAAREHVVGLRPEIRARKYRAAGS